MRARRVDSQPTNVRSGRATVWSVTLFEPFAAESYRCTCSLSFQSIIKEVSPRTRENQRDLFQAVISALSHILQRPRPRSTTGLGMSGYLR